MERIVGKRLFGRNLKKVLSIMLIIIVMLTSIRLDGLIVNAEETTSYITLFLIDNTLENWIGDNDAVIELVDNTFGHDRYTMIKVSDTIWSVNVPESAYNITFNRYNSEKTTQWNSWSAGGRDSNNAYYADGSEYGHWGYIEGNIEENYFHAGDIVYLDLTEFSGWKNNDAKLYINFTGASKQDNNGVNIDIANSDKSKYNPKNVDIEVVENVYAYVVDFEDEGATELRFWRGNNTTLWNCSIVLSYDNYVNGLNCVKIQNWNDNGALITSENNMDTELDSDGDGLADYYEIIHKTDINNVDTDGDGLTDYQEINETATSPLIIDTDGNGISDAEEDNDKDGLTNIEEYRLGTSIFTVDTDADLISDYDEVYIYKTNPLVSDTDGDGADDKWEIDNNFNPLVYNDSFEINDRVQGNDSCVEVNLVADGNSASSFEVNVHENGPNDINSTIPGYLGNGFDFSMEGEFESADIKYYFNEEYIDEEGFNPVVYYYNEESNEMEEIDTLWDGVSNYVTASLPHFSTYLLLNKTKFEEVWNTQIKNITSDENGNFNINVAFIVDLSGSMRGTKLSTTKTAISSFINVLEENDYAGLISFTNDAIVHSEMTNDKESLYEKINNMSAYGLTSIYTGLDKGVQMLSNSNRSGYNMIIVFTDGYDEPSTTYDRYYKEIVDRAVENDICIYTIGIETVDENLLTKIAENTGGHYYYASLISELQDKIDEVKEEAEDLTKDSNNDGISDYHTKLICEGKLRYSNGAAVQGFIGNYEEIQKNADFDGDGLVNGDEITVGTTSGGRPCVKMMSNPIFSDTDFDGYTDLEEKMNGTNVFYPNANCYAVDTLLNDTYVASIFADDYENDWWTKTQLFAGNLITNFKYSYVSDYRKVLLTYVQQYIDSSYEQLVFENTKLIETSKVKDEIEEITNYMLSFSDVVNESMEYSKAVAQMAQCNNKMISLGNTITQINSYSKLVGWDDELRNTLLNIHVQLEEQKSLLSASNRTKNSLKLNGELTKTLGNFSNKLPSKAVTAIKTLKAFNDFLTYGMIVLDTSCNIADTLEIYSSINAGVLQYTELKSFLEAITANSNIEEMREAAKDVKYALEDDMDKILVELSDILYDVESGLLTTEATLILTHTGPLGWAIYLGWTLGNLISNTGEIDEKLLGVIALGDSAKCYAENIKKELSKDTMQYYMITENTNKELQLLAQLRIVGEDKYAEVSNCRSKFRKWIEKKLGNCSQSDIEDYCKDEISNIIDKCGILGIVVTDKFKDHYLSY